MRDMLGDKLSESFTHGMVAIVVLSEQLPPIAGRAQLIAIVAVAAPDEQSCHTPFGTWAIVV